MKFKNYLKCENGATAIEYVLLSAGIGVSIMIATYSFGEDISNLFDGLDAVSPILTN